MECYEETKEKLIEDAKLYIKHIYLGRGNAFVMAKKIILDIKNKKFRWNDIGITPGELADKIDGIANDTLIMLEDRAEELVADYSGIIDFLDGKTRT